MVMVIIMVMSVAVIEPTVNPPKCKEKKEREQPPVPLP